MSRWRGLDVGAEGTGISRPLSEQINLLGALLGQALRDQAGDETLERVEELRLACKRAVVEGDPALREQAAERIAALDLPEIRWLLSAFTSFFHLVNQAEKQEIIRINRERSRAAEGGRPRPESLDETVGRLAAGGAGLGDVLALLGRLDVQPTLTAHPTEARRRTLLVKQQRISALLARLGSAETTPEERGEAVDRLYVEISLLLATDEIPAERPTVRDEVDQGIYFLRHSLWETVPRLHRDALHALRKHFPGRRSRDRPDDRPHPAPLPAPALLDRQRPRRQPERHRGRHALDRAPPARGRARAAGLRATGALRRALALRPSGTGARGAGAEPAGRGGARRRRARSRQAARPRAVPARRSARMIERLEALRAGRRDRRALPPGGLSGRPGAGSRARSPRAASARWRATAGCGACSVLAEAFGFRLAGAGRAPAQPRSTRRRWRSCSRLAGVRPDYAALPEEERACGAGAGARQPAAAARPAAPGCPTPPATCWRRLRWSARRSAWDPGSVACYVVSMTHEVSDLLEVLLLTQEAGLWRGWAGRRGAAARSTWCRCSRPSRTWTPPAS